MASRTGLVKRRVRNLKTNTSSEGDLESSFSARKRKANVPAPKKRSPVKPALSKQNRSNSKKKRSAVPVKMANTKNTGNLTKTSKSPAASTNQCKISPDVAKNGEGATTPAGDCKTPAISIKDESPTTPYKKGKYTLRPTIPTGKKNSAASTSKGKASSASTSRAKTSAVSAIRKARTSAPSTSKAVTTNNRATKRKVTDTNNDPPTTPKMTKKDDDSQRELRQTIVDMKNKILKDNRPKKHTVDNILKEGHPDAEVYGDYSCILAKIINGKYSWLNTFFVIQITTDAERYVFFWRDTVNLKHHPGKHESKTFNNIEDAIENFKKLFKTKTKNDWETREDFVIHERKYTLLDIDEEADELYSKIDIRDHIPYKEFSPSEKDCPLPYKTQTLLAQMFYELTSHRIRCVLQPETGAWAERKLAKLQLLKGLEVLLDLDEAITKGEPHEVLEQFSKNFYSLLPLFCCKCLEDADDIRKSIDTICILTGIISGPYGAMKRVKIDIHPLLEIYQSLDCELVLLEDTAPEYQLFDEYARDSPESKLLELQSIWRVDCKAERERFKTYDNEPNHKLLWYENMGIAMWKSLEKGVNEYDHKVFFRANCNPRYYVNYKDMDGFEDSEGVSIAFLVEVALGKEFHHFKHHDFGGGVPDGYDSFLVRGTCSPDPANDKIIVLDGKNVTIPAWKRVEDFEADKVCSSILSYHLIYGEARARLRYMLKFKDK